MSDDLRLLSLTALRDLEARALAATGEGELMQRAGQAAWRHALQFWPEARRILVACGPGNNGGDGREFARFAAESGRDVRVVEPAGFNATLPPCDLVVDALFGIGLSRAPDGAEARLIDAINAQSAPVLALDVPSGVDADTGHVPGVAVNATRTLEFIAHHRGLVTGAACDHVGVRALDTLGVPEALRDAVPPSLLAVDGAGLASRLGRRPRNAHKGLFGHVLCIGGDHGMGGAVVLATEAALRTGAGKVSVATRPDHVPVLLARRPECMPAQVDSVDDLAPLLASATAVAIGPGLGRARWGQGLFAAVLASGKPLVIDADALNLLVDSAHPVPGAVLTPHPGEAARLLGISTQEVQANRPAALERLVAKFACAVVLKGCGSLVGAPGEIPRVVTAGNPGMAGGGMGDALTGIIAALMAQGHSAFDAAWVGAAVHAGAGDRARDAVGERGLLASDLIAHIPEETNRC